jgi:hypothetical protein
VTKMCRVSRAVTAKACSRGRSNAVHADRRIVFFIAPSTGFQSNTIAVVRTFRLVVPRVTR